MMNIHLHNPMHVQAVRGKVNVITSRQTIFGFHYPHTSSRNLEPMTTKTNLMAFADKDNAIDFMDTLERFQKTNRFFPDRVHDGSVSTYRTQGPFHVMKIEEVDIDDLSALCNIHWFDMCVVTDVQIIDRLDDITMLDINEQYLSYEFELRGDEVVAEQPPSFTEIEDKYTIYNCYIMNSEEPPREVSVKFMQDMYTQTSSKRD